MDNKGLLTIVIILLIGVIVILAAQNNEKKASPGDRITNAVSETFEEVADEIDDNTDAK